ncbi:hypothetical protein [Planctomycetes bacterium CA13]
MQDSKQAGGATLIFLAIMVACIVMCLLSIAVSGDAILKILETTPFMGIAVDEQGNRIPVQGYPQLGFGLLSAIFFAILASYFGMLRKKHRIMGIGQTKR